MHDPHPHGAQSLDGAGVILDIGAEYHILYNSTAMRCVASNEIPLNDR
jgi:Xaa-Pro aminopeptidase